MVCPVCQAALKQSNGQLHCTGCGETFPISVSGIPVMIPAEAYHRFPVQKGMRIYDRAYANPGVMGTQLDIEYSRVTKTGLLSFCQDAPNARILDVGTGDGDLGEFVSANHEWYGIDLSETGIRCAQERFVSLKGAVAICEWLPYPSEFFGAVIAADTIEHTFDLPQSLCAIRRVLAPGGIFALSVPTPNSLRKWTYNRLIRGGPSLSASFRLLAVVMRRLALFGKANFQPIDRDLTLDQWYVTLADAGFHIAVQREWPTAPFRPMVYLLSARVSI